MADMEFDLGEALGSYEQAQADRNFYLSMVQEGTTAASPIAAYLAGVAGVKMANTRQKYQQAMDARQAQKDALEATERLNKRASDLDKQILQVAEGVGNGTIAPGIGAAMMGPLLKERGYTLKNYDTDNNIAVYTDPTDMQDYEFDFNARPSQLEAGRQARSEARIGWEREKQKSDIEAKKELANLKKTGSSASSKGATVSNKWQTFKAAHGPIIDVISGKDIVNNLSDFSDEQLQGFLDDYIEDFAIDSIRDIVAQELESRLNEQPSEQEQPQSNKSSSGIVDSLIGKWFK